MSSSSPVTGERSREAEELYRTIAEAGVLAQTVMVFGQINAPAGGFERGPEGTVVHLLAGEGPLDVVVG